MGDNPKPLGYDQMTYKNYPVNVQAIRIDWIFDFGLPFLQALYESDSHDLLDN